MKTDYYLITGEYFDERIKRDFNGRVNNFLRDGYELYGYPVVTTMSNNRVIYSQAVVKI